MKGFDQRRGRVRGGLVRTLLAGGLALPMLLAGCGNDNGGGDGDDYPNHDIRLVVPFSAGGTLDPIGRAYAQRLGDQLGVSVVVDNVTGASGTLGVNEVLSSEPDGYTLGFGSSSVFGFNPLVQGETLWESIDDIAIIGDTTHYAGGMIVVPPGSPWETFDEMLADAESRPGEIGIASGGVFNLTDIGLRHFVADYGGGEIFNVVPFDGGGADALAALLGGQVEAAIANPVTLHGQLQAGEVRGLVYIAGPEWREEMEVLADLPSIRDYGSDATTEATNTIFTLPGVPESILSVLRETHMEIMRNEEFQEELRGLNGVPLPADYEQSRETLLEFQEYYRNLYENVDIGQ